MSSPSSSVAALRHRDFRWLWSGTFCSTASQWIQQATIGWVVYDITGSGTLLGAVLGIRALPMLLLSPLSGVVADRADRRRVLAATQAVLAVASLVLAAALAFDRVQVWHLFAFTVVAGAAMAFDRTLRGSLVLDAVPRSDVANAVALNSVAFSVTRALGPAVAGFLIAWVGPAWNFVIQAVMYSGVAASVLMMQPRQRGKHGRRGSAWAGMKEGLRYAAADPVLRIMVVLGLVPPLLLIPSFSALMPVFAVDVFVTGPEGLGLLLSAVGVGGIVGGVLAARMSRFERVGLLQSLALVVFAIALIGFAASPGMPMALVCLAVAGAAEMVHVASHHTTLQMSAPEEMRGRIASLLPVFPAFIAVGSLVAGAGADLVGPQAFVLGSSCAGLLIIWVAWTRSQALRGLQLSKLVSGS